jgi:hypothetical protein
MQIAQTIGGGTMRWQSRRGPASLVALSVVALLPFAPMGTRLLGQTSQGPATSSFAFPSIPSANHSVVHISLYALGGAIVGGWTGYVCAQVAWSDWRDNPGRRGQRVRFSVAGAAIGLVAGLVISTRTPGAVRPMPPVSTPGQEPISEKEIRASAARSLSQLLRERRPLWLRSRGVDVLAPYLDPLKADGVRVYLNGELLGGVDTLDDVSIDAVTRIEFLDASAAVLRWGAGNDDGAILLTTGASK